MLIFHLFPIRNFVDNSEFGTNNPFTYYNSKKVDESVTVDGTQIQNYGDHAAYYLGLLDAVDTGSVAYNLTIQVDFN